MVNTNGRDGGNCYIQWLGSTATCCECGKELSSGPVGVSNLEPKGPICDSCFIQLDLHLGSILWLANFTREAARSMAHATPEEGQIDMYLLMLFAMLFDQHAQFPRRRSNTVPVLSDFMKRGESTTLEQLSRKLSHRQQTEIAN